MDTKPPSDKQKLCGAKATPSQLSNDLFWSIFIGGAFLRWSGYNDGYWWREVSGTDQFQVREHKGRRYRLNPQTCDVTDLGPTP